MTTKKGRIGREPYAGMWDFDGACAPREGSAGQSMHRTFTLGVFQWVPMPKGKKLKRGKVIWRVKGTCDTEGIVDAHEKAREFCAKKQSQEADT